MLNSPEITERLSSLTGKHRRNLPSYGPFFKSLCRIWLLFNEPGQTPIEIHRGRSTSTRSTECRECTHTYWALFDAVTSPYLREVEHHRVDTLQAVGTIIAGTFALMRSYHQDLREDSGLIRKFSPLYKFPEDPFYGPDPQFIHPPYHHVLPLLMADEPSNADLRSLCRSCTHDPPSTERGPCRLCTQVIMGYLSVTGRCYSQKRMPSSTRDNQQLDRKVLDLEALGETLLRDVSRFHPGPRDCSRSQGGEKSMSAGRDY